MSVDDKTLGGINTQKDQNIIQVFLRTRAEAGKYFS